jgi:hypothetical protein
MNSYARLNLNFYYNKMLSTFERFKSDNTLCIMVRQDLMKSWMRANIQEIISHPKIPPIAITCVVWVVIMRKAF